MAMKDRMHTGALYLPGDDEIMNRQQLCLDRLYEFNHTRPSETDKRQALMKEMFAELGENCYIEPPFYSTSARPCAFGQPCVLQLCRYHGGRHPYLYRRQHDDRPQCDHRHRRPSGAAETAGVRLPIQYAGAHWPYLLDRAGAVILPGVTVGDNTVIGAGSVVTKDIPANVVAVGNPCRVLRPISDRDKNTTSGITPLTMQRLPGIWKKSNKYKTNPAGSRNGRLRGDFLYV